MVQKLTWSGVYLRITLSNNLLHKVLKLVPLIATGPEFFVATMTKSLSNSYDALEETITYTKSIKINNYLGENVAYL